jgi:hypothetical protein
LLVAIGIKDSAGHRAIEVDIGNFGDSISISISIIEDDTGIICNQCKSLIYQCPAEDAFQSCLCLDDDDNDDVCEWIFGKDLNMVTLWLEMSWFWKR